MILYHVSTKLYSVGDIISVNNFSSTTEYYQNSEGRGKKWIDDYLDSIRPQDAPSRKRTIYAFDSLANCGAFIGRDFNNFHYYKVEMDDPVVCPMCLTDKLEVDNIEKNAIIGNEYWRPTIAWSFLEYLKEEMIVIEILPPPNFLEIAAGRFAYGKDRDLSNNTFK